MIPFLTKKIMGLATWVWILLVLTVGGAGIWYMQNAPRHAGWRYGACRVFLEQYVRFPTTIDIKQAYETPGGVFISFTDTNPFGSQQVRVFECYFGAGKNGQTALTRITLDRKALPAETVQIFNARLPIITSQELNTALPKDLPGDLEDYKK